METPPPVRKPLRIPNYDYNTPGAYFLTFCTHNRKHMLSRIVGAIHESPAPQLTTCGRIVDTVIKNIPEHLSVTIDQYIIMPNHIHLIAVVRNTNILWETDKSHLQSRSVISKLIGYIKMNASRAIRQRYGEVTVWQRGYYDHIIRNQEDYGALTEYIQTNPLRWELDKLYLEE